VGVLTGEVIGIFAHVQRAHEDRALRFQLGDERGVRLGGGMVAVDARARESDFACDVVEVLNGEAGVTTSFPRGPSRRRCRASHDPVPLRGVKSQYRSPFSLDLPLVAWASALRMKWTRQRCHLAFMTLETAVFMPR